MAFTAGLRFLRVKHLAQVASLAVLGTVLVAILAVREFRTAGSGADLDSRLDGLSSVVYGGRMSRPELFRNALVLPRLNAQRVGDPARLQALLPAGATFDVFVKGGFVAPRLDNLRGQPLRTHLAYAFEMSYRRVIESNDGQRIVERRTFGPVRMAKILAATEMQLNLGPRERTLFDRVRFPAASDGLAVGDLHAVAAAMLGAAGNAVEQSDVSLALLETDRLSEKTVRLTYVDGLGIESVEGLDGPLSGRQLLLLFRQFVVPPGLCPADPNADPAFTRMTVNDLASISDPTRSPADGGTVLLQAVAGPEGRTSCSHVLYNPEEYSYRNRQAAPTQAELRAATRMGTLYYDPEGTFISRATIHWPLGQLEVFSECLLYENPFVDIDSELTMTVDYFCRRVADASG
jgi:hypothetical protein